MTPHETLPNFFAVDGPNGVGKGTFLKALVLALQQEYPKVMQTFQPGGTDFGALLRHILKTGIHAPTATAQLYGFLADRIQHLDTSIRPALAEGTKVITDRYTFSTLVYQHVFGKAHPMAVEHAWAFPRPAITFLCIADPGVIARRRDGRGEAPGSDIFEQSADRELQAYAQIAEEARARGWNVQIIDSTAPLFAQVANAQHAIRTL